MDDLLKALHQNPVFADIPMDVLRELEKRSCWRRYKRNQSVLIDGDEAREVFVLTRGTARVHHSTRDGASITLKILRAPAIFGEAEVLGKFPRFVESVEAIEAAEALIIPGEVLLALLRAYPSAAMALLVDVSARLAIASYMEKALFFHPVTVRLANYLVDFGIWTNDEGATQLQIFLTQDELASAIGASRRAVAEDMIAWQKAGVIERRGAHYVVKDIEYLQRLVDPRRLPVTYSLAPHLQ